MAYESDFEEDFDDDNSLEKIVKIQRQESQVQRLLVVVVVVIAEFVFLGYSRGFLCMDNVLRAKAPVPICSNTITIFKCLYPCPCRSRSFNT